MLKAVVQDVDGTAEPAFGQAAGQITIGRHQDRHARECTRQHLRFVARFLCWHLRAVAVAHHDDAVGVTRAAIAAAEDDGMFACRQEEPRDGSHDRGFTTAAHHEIADTDDRPGQPPHPIGMPAVPRATKSRRTSVHPAEQSQWITRKGRTTDRSRPSSGTRPAITASVLSFAPRFASTRARAAAPRRARRTGSPMRPRIADSSSLFDRTCSAASLARNASAISAKFSMCGPNTIGLPKTAGSRMLWPPARTRLPPTNTTVAI